MTANDLIELLRAGAIVVNNLTINVAEQIITGDNAIVDKRNITIDIPRDAIKALPDHDPWAWRYEDLQKCAAQHQRDYADECARRWAGTYYVNED